MADDRIQIKLYEAALDDSEIIAWIKGLPYDPLGKRKIKENVVPSLAEAIRRQTKAVSSAAPRRIQNATYRAPPPPVSTTPNGRNTLAETGSIANVQSGNSMTPVITKTDEVSPVIENFPKNGEATERETGPLTDSFVLDDLMR